MIWRKESGKIWKYPLVWGLLLLFFLFNLWNIYISVGTYSRREWRKMHEISRDGHDEDKNAVHRLRAEGSVPGICE